MKQIQMYLFYNLMTTLLRFQRVLHQDKDDDQHLSGQKAKNENLKPAGNNRAGKVNRCKCIHLECIKTKKSRVNGIDIFLACLFHSHRWASSALKLLKTQNIEQKLLFSHHLPLIGPLIAEEPLYSSQLPTISYWGSHLAPTSWIELMI